jgi:hypothetical protein
LIARPKAIAWAKSHGIVAGTVESLDEYPFASTDEGGPQDWLRAAAVPQSEQEIQKQDLGTFYRRVSKKKPFQFIVALVH